MATYWLENITEQSKCRDDYHSLLKARYSKGGLSSSDAYTCTYCGSIYLPFINAETAFAHPDIKTNYLSGKAKKEIQFLRTKEEREKARKEAEAEREKQEKLRQIKEEEARKRREREARIRAIEEEKRAKKNKLIENLYSVFKTDYLGAEAYLRDHDPEKLLTTEEFRDLQNRFVADWFENNTPPADHRPDRYQRAAIAATQKNIEVVARAGSGKTATIVNRFRFLTEQCKTAPSSVLMLAFNKKAADDLRAKTEALFPTYDENESNMPHIMTFHALAYSIVHPEETLIYDDENSGERTLSKAVQEIIDEKIRDDAWASKIREVMLLHFKGNWETIEAGGNNLPKEQQLIYRRSLQNQTLNNEYVKSYGEKVIANILFEHDIDYTYEKYFKWHDGSPYRPDFTVYNSAGKPIIIEYLGMTGNFSYDLETKRKEEYWAERETQLIEVFPEDVAGDTDSLAEELLGFLAGEGVEYRELTEEEIWEKIKARAIDEFTKAITTFIGRCRKNDLTEESLNILVQSYSSELPTEVLFLELACDIYVDYLQKLQREGLEDFDGLMSRAVQIISQGKTRFDRWINPGDLRDLTHIMIDEYQDFSYLFDRFLAAIRTICPQADIFCVGDDWQAINAFAGSDTRYFRDFRQRYEDSERYSLQTNYRSKGEIVTVATRLMARGDAEGNIRASRQGNGTVRLGNLSGFVPDPAENVIHDYDRLTPAILRLVNHILEHGKDVVFLTRTNERLPLYFICRTKAAGAGSSSDRFLDSVRSFFSSEKRYNSKGEERITASTTHKYKGKENDAVIILDAIAGFYPLIHPAWIFQRVFGDSIEQLMEEEKRLFYVALSRAKDDLYILTLKGEESPFLQELGQIEPLRWDDYSPVKTDRVSVKIEVCNQPGHFLMPPTMLIKEQLKADDYKWDAKNLAWYRYFSRDDYSIEEVLSQEWTHMAENVILIQYDEKDQIEEAYLFADGDIKRIDMEGEETE